MALVSCAIAACMLAACGDTRPTGIPADAVAAVEGKGITKAEVESWIRARVISNSVGTPFEHGAVAPDPPRYERCVAHLQELARRGHRSPSPETLRQTCERQYRLFLQEAVTALITERWELAEGAAHGVSISPASVEQKLEADRAGRYPSRAELERELVRHGETVAELRSQIERDLITERVQASVDAGKGRVTPAEVERFYATHRSAFGPGRSANLRVILTRTAAEATVAKRELAAGVPFASVATRRSISPTRHAGGLYEGLEPGQAPETLEKAVFAARPGVVGGPIKTLVGYWLFELVSLKAHGAQTLAQAAPQITEHLHDEKESALNKQFAEELIKRWTARTECRPGYVVERCKEYRGGQGAEATTTTP